MNIAFHSRTFSEGVYDSGRFLGTIDLEPSPPLFMPSWNYRQLELFDQAIVDTMVENRIAVFLLAARLTS